MITLELAISLIFVVGYGAIISEAIHKLDKAATALLTGVLGWVLYLGYGGGTVDLRIDQLLHHLSDISQLLFFLMGAMLIVEVIDAHHGFNMIGSLFRFSSPKIMLLVVLTLSFYMSAVLDNLTTLIVMTCLMKKVIPDRKERLILTASLIAAVNAGGAWTPIGDVTTTMLWIAERISSVGIIFALFVPSLAYLIVFALLVMPMLPKKIQLMARSNENPPPSSKRVFFIGFISLILVPVWKTFLHLPPFMGVLLGLAALWIYTDFAHARMEERKHLRVYSAMGRIDMSVIYFFLGILLAVDVLQSAGILATIATTLQNHIGSQEMIAVVIGLVSAIVDNVPLVAAAIKMYPLDVYPKDSSLWNLIAFCAGTGGSILIIGSAPGVALMSLEKVEFMWYLRKFSLITLIAYFAGILVYHIL